MAKQNGDVGTSVVSTPVSGPNPMASITKGSYGRDYNKDGRIGFFESLRDMTDGGGPGVSGGPFRGGGMLSAVGNALTGNRGMGVGPEAGVGFAGYGYQGPNGWVTAAQDMMNGGGAGMMGPSFRGGGMYSGLLNFLGVTPMGAGDLQEPEMTVGTEKTPALSEVIASTSSPMPRPDMSMLPQPSGIGATPATAYVAPQGYDASGMNPISAYGPYNAVQMGEPGYSAVMPPPRIPDAPAVVPMQITPNDYYTGLLSQMQRFR